VHLWSIYNFTLEDADEILLYAKEQQSGPSQRKFWFQYAGAGAGMRAGCTKCGMHELHPGFHHSPMLRRSRSSIDREDWSLKDDMAR